MNGAIINRSLSRKELKILTTINALYHKKFPWISSRISDTLIKNQPRIEAQKCKIAKPQLRKVYETNDAHLLVINEFLNSKEQLTSLTDLNQDTAQGNSPEQARKIREEEAISVSLIGNTLLQVLTNESKRKLSNDTVDAIIALSQSGQVSKNTEVELLEVAKENRPQGEKLAQLLVRAQKELSSLK